MIKKILSLNQVFVIILLGFSVLGCSQFKRDLRFVTNERDSLKIVLDSSQRQLSMINMIVTTINSTMDSIALQEGILFINEESGAQLGRKDAIHNLDRFQEILKKLTVRINELEQELEFSGSNENKNMQDLLDLMKVQLLLKEQQLLQLRKELSKKNVNIAELRKQINVQALRIERQSDTISQLDKKNKVQIAALEYQDKMINRCYVLIGTTSDLQRKGVLKKKKLQSDVFSNAKFAKIDVRKFKEISFTAKRPRILTNMPTSAYTLTTSGNNEYLLKIIDPTLFWSISNYLVIQTD